MYSAGRGDGPLVLFVHGWAQSARCWRHQFADPALTAAFRLAALDLRGHGESDRPDGGYDDPRLWAADLAAVLAALAPGGPAILVGWSYGGLVIADHLSVHGCAGVAGVLLTGAITGIGRGVRAGRIGPVMRAALPDALSPDPDVALPALTAFTRRMTPAPHEDAAALLAAALAVPPRVRAALFARTEDGSRFVDAVTRANLPVLVQHGTADPVVDRSTAEHHLTTVPGAEGDWWEGAGHLPFAEDPVRFAAALAAFAGRCNKDRERMAT